jgi:cell division protease FtsH
MVGADLANLVNEAALLAARRGREAVASPDFSDSLEKIVLGAERQIMMSDADRRRTAYHEAGHALVGMLTIGADPVRKVSIIPRGVALGVTFASPDSDRFNYSKDDLVARIKVALGGRAAEEVAFGDITTGAENDIEQITRVARYMVGRWGMSDKIGLVAVLPDGDQPSFNSESFSPRIRELVDDEVLRIVGDAHDEVLALLRSERERLDALAEMLLEKETLDEVDAYAAAGVPRRRKPVSTA